MRQLLILIFAVGTLAFTIQQPPLQQNLEISRVEAPFLYGEVVQFKAHFQPPALIKELYLFIQPAGSPVRVERVSLDTEGNLNFRYDLRDQPLTPFARTSYWFRAALDGLPEFTSEIYSFDYEDNRYTWQKLESGGFVVRWYERDLAFGQEVLNTAHAGLESAQRYLPASLEQPVRIYVYNSTEAFQQAMTLSGDSWMAGHASPEVNAILVSIPPGPEETLELERQVPHEIAHVLQYRLLGEDYTRVPTWLLEGSASLAELYPNSGYSRALEEAAKNDQLIPISKLCGPLPQDAEQAFLAYAQSASFTRFLHLKYGSSGLEALLLNYQDGLSCVDGTQRTLDRSLDDLDAQWQQETLGVDVGSRVFHNLAPFLALLALLVFVPLAASLVVKSRN